MANRSPLILASGKFQQLQSGDFIANTPQLLASGTVAAASTCPINMSAYFNLFPWIRIVLTDLLAGTNSADLQLQTSQDGTTFDVAASNYRYAGVFGNDGASTVGFGSPGDTKIIMNGTTSHVGAVSARPAEAFIDLFQCGLATRNQRVKFDHSYVNNTASSNLDCHAVGTGSRLTTAVLKGVNIFYSAGTISVIYRVWGYP